MTYQGSNATVVGWNPDGSEILYSSDAGEPHWTWLWSVSPEGGEPQRHPYGPVKHVTFGPSGGVALGRMTRDPATWKRYRGGTAGRLWVDVKGDGDFQLLEPANGNFTTPMWIGERIYFISDHEGIGNIYSCLPTGEQLRQHTDQTEYYARWAQTDWKRIVYHAGADLFVYDIESDSDVPVDIEFRSPRIQRQRKFTSPAKYLQDFYAHPDGHALVLTVRGKPFTMANWEGAVLQKGERDGVRYRLTQFLNDGKRLVTISDAGGEEAVEIHAHDAEENIVRLEGIDIGRSTGLEVSPQNDQIAISNHRFELLLVDLETKELRRLDRSEYGNIAGFSWSPDGRWIAYGFASTERTTSIKVCKVETGETWMVTPAEFFDFGPAWDPESKQLYFLSYREFKPVYDHIHFELSFPQAMRPMLVTLKKDVLNPFVPLPRPLEEKKEEEKKGEGKKDENGDEEEEKSIEIDFEGIEQRVVAFPYPEGRYGRIAGMKNKVLFTSFPVESAIQTFPRKESEPKGTLHLYDFKEQKKDKVVTGVDSFVLSRDSKVLIYRSGDRLRAIKAGEKPSEDGKSKGSDEPSRRSGWLDLNRIKASIVPTAEWKQMYREAWRLQRDYFWTEDMSDVDWERVYERYLPLLERIATRSEFSDLLWEMQGELGTSHAYEFGGDYRSSPNYQQGFLGADFVCDEKTSEYRLTHIVHGDAWEETKDSPLNEPGINVKVGDSIIAVGGQGLNRERSPGELLVNLGGQEVELTIRDSESGGNRKVIVKALRSEREARYREFVSRNRTYVREKTDEKVGYVHIPDMVGNGFAEFHRGYLAEISCPGLIIDVRFNRGGHVSPLILEKLAQRRIGYDIQRWGKPVPYPYDSVLGPLVAITNELAGSDGDIFSHCFKLMKLGLLIGKRTWGGVIGINPQSRFVDGGLTTQPEYSFWFTDVGWEVENYGTDPDIEVDYRPQDFKEGNDPQLDRAIEEILKQMDENPPKLPDFGERPRLTLPT